MVEAIVEATSRVLETEGVDAASVNRICEVAGVAPGSFYQYFPDKQAVFYMLLRQHAEDVTARLVGVLQQHAMDDVPDLVRAAVDAMVAAHRERPAVHAALGIEVARRAGPGLEEGLMSPLETAVRGLVNARAPEGRDPGVIAFLAARALESLVHAAVRDRADLLQDRAFTDELTRMLVRYLED